MLAMFCRWIIITVLCFVAEITLRPINTVYSLPTVAEAFRSHLRSSSGSAAGDTDEFRLVISRGTDILASTLTDVGHHREITLTITAFNETYVLDLKLNTHIIFASTYIEKVITNSGEIYNDVNHVHIRDHCYYTGDVRSKSQSTAAVATCNGIDGDFAIGNVSYHIESKRENLIRRHRIYRNRNDLWKSFICGNDRQISWISDGNLTSSDRLRIKRSFLYPPDQDRVNRVIEIYVANDHSQYLAKSGNVGDVFLRTKQILNVASLAYESIGISLVLVGVEVWTDSDRFPILDSNVDGTLSSWYKYRRNSIPPSHYNDFAVLITNVAFYSGIVGKANFGSMCSNQFSGAIISDLSSVSAVTGTTLAHELGHSFGLQHDEQFSDCSCDDTNSSNHCIMTSSTDPRRLPTKWSSCSREQFATAFSQGLDLCLHDIPQTNQISSFCGNGIVEDGEECDCGKSPNNASYEDCNSTCCNNNTCQLVAPAECAFGNCCDTATCQIKSSGTECRSKSNDCDLSESCNGVDARCPTDSYKPDGTDCRNSEPAYCYQGMCRSHRSQCQFLWGPGTEVSNDLCYARFNTNGKYYGNCGLKWTDKGVDYIPCAARDVKCGRLQCQDVPGRTLYSYKRYYSMSTTYIGTQSCRSVVFDFGIKTPDPGVVPNGAKCGERQMCINQRCVNIAKSTGSELVMSTSTQASSSPATTAASTTTGKSTTTTRTTTTADDVARIDVVLAIVIGTMVFATAACLLLFCCYMFCPAAFVSCCQLLHIAGPTTSKLPLVSLAMSTFSRRIMITRQYRRLRMPVE